MSPLEYKASFDQHLEDFCKRNSFHFYPWVGQNYNNGYYNKRLLIIGESYYLADWNLYGNLNIDIVKDASPLAIRKYIGEVETDDKKAFRTFDIATRILMGCRGNISNIQKKSLWDTALYYVFKQDGYRKHVKDNSAFSNEELENGLHCLDAIINEYQPEIAIIYSRNIYKRIAQNAQEFIIKRNDKGSIHIATFWVYNGVKILGIPHPSVVRSNYERAELHNLFRELCLE